MSDFNEETVIVRDREGMRQFQADSWTTTTLVGAISVDPRSFDELARAWLRYEPDTPLEELDWENCTSEPVRGPWLMLDLACLRIVAGRGAELPENPAAFQRDEGPWTPGMPAVWINLPPDWQCVVAVSWEEALPPPPIRSEPLDARGILFGRALAEGIARRTLEMARTETFPAERVSRNSCSDENGPNESQREINSDWHALTVRVHVDWLMTPREDLDGEPPRPFLHRGRDWVEREVENRQRQWSNQGGAPRALDRDTFAYRYSPFGRHEVVMYFDLCRKVIDAAWDRIVERPEIDEAVLTRALYEHSQLWIAEGSIDGESTPPAAIIECERRRMPLVGDGSHLDCDCPICRMQSDGAFGPMFRGFDGHHLELDDEFAFSLCATREEWDKQQEEYVELGEALETKRLEREASGEEPFESMWSSSYVSEELVEQAGSSSPFALMALAMRLSEFVSDLKDAGAGRELIESLNEAFDSYRTAADDLTLVAASKMQVGEILEQVAAMYPDLTAKAADLQSQLDDRQRKQARFDFPS